VIADDKPNPFHVLGLPTNATQADIAARAEELSDLAPTDEARLLYRWAREQIITHPRTRLEYEIFEVPGAQYDDDGWERFSNKYRRNPVDVRGLAAAGGDLDVSDFDLVALMSVLLDGLLEVPPPDATALVAHAPFEVGSGPPPIEVRDVIFG